MSQCHKCKYDARNGGRSEDRQAHCLTCKFEDCTSMRLKGKAEDGGPRVIELDAGAVPQDYISLDAVDVNRGGDILEELELEESQVQLIMDFVSAFSSLPLRHRLVALAMLEHGGNNTELVKATGISRTTLIEKRQFLEADPFWSKMLKRAAIFRLQKRKSAIGKRGLKKGTKLKVRKWGSKYRLPPEEGEE